MSDTLIAAIAGSVSALIASAIGALISYRLLKSEYQNKFRMELINKQIDACEKLWLALITASKSKGKDHVLQYRKEKIFINLRAAIELHKNLVDALNQSSGLYFSKDLRSSIFDLKDYLELEIDFDTEENENLISNTKANKLDGYVQNVRMAIRRELNLENLQVTKEGPV